MKFRKEIQPDTPNQYRSKLLSRYPTNTRLAESYRTLRTNISFAFMEKDLRSLLITSSGPKEGKTMTVFNLAYIMAQTGMSVLMVDADLRNPVLTRVLPSKGSIGLTGLISNIFGTAIEQGNLGSFGVSDLLKLILLQKKTGLLRLDDGREKVEILCLQGKIKDLNWLTRPEDQKLATILTSNKTLTKAQVKQALSRQQATGQKLGFILINSGILTKEDLSGHLTMHMLEGLRIALQFSSGEFSFKELSEADFEHSSFDPVDFDQIYQQVIIGDEQFPYLQAQINSAVIETGTPGLSLLPSGILPPNPSELLGSQRMLFLLSHLQKRFDLLIIDSPPLLPASDALLIAPQTDGVVLIVKAGQVDRNMISSVVEQLRSAKADILGVVLNHVDVQKEGYYKYYHKYYSSYYGKDK